VKSATSGTDVRNQVLQATNIVDLIGRSVALKRQGRDFVGLCPFHQEKTPSFHVSPSKQFFHCFGCKASGNAIDFVIRQDRVEFIDALRQLAEQAGIELPRAGGQGEPAGERQSLLEANSAACGFFEKLLQDPSLGAAAREYLEKRRIDAASVQRFRIGVAPDAWNGLLKSQAARKYPPHLLVRAGLVKNRGGDETGAGGFYDTFRNRLMFPIRDEGGRIVAFGGRVMPGSQDPAKYLNSPETPLFSKSRCIYGLDLARQKIVETRTAVVVEGYTDVIMAHQFGVSNVVSVLGTAMTEQHLSILRRFADRVVLLFDADTAGDTAVDRSIELFLRQPIEIAIASMPPGVDPDEYLLEHGAEAFENVLNGATDALSFKWKQLTRRLMADEQDLTGQQKAVEAYLGLLADSRGSGPVDPLRWAAVLARVSRLTSIPIEVLNQKFRLGRSSRGGVAHGGSGRTSTQARPAGEPTQVAPPPAAATARDRVERWILGVLLSEPPRWQDVQQHIAPEDFTGEQRQKLAETYWDHQRHEGEPVFNEFLSLLEQPELKKLAVELVEEASSLNSMEEAMADAVAHLRRARQRQEEHKLVAELRRNNHEKLSDQDEVSLLRQLQDKVRRPDLHRVGG
jgi:DNA primase